jgi:hypothetical protein
MYCMFEKKDLSENWDAPCWDEIRDEIFVRQTGLDCAAEAVIETALKRIVLKRKHEDEMVEAGSNKRVLRKTSLDEIAEDSLWEIMKYLSEDEFSRWKQTSKFHSANKGNTAWLKFRLLPYVTKSKHDAMMREYTEAQLLRLFKKLSRWLRHRSVFPLPSEFPRAELDEDILHKHAVLAAVKDDAEALEHASDRMKDDKDVVLAASSLDYASDRLRNDKDAVLAAVKIYGLTLEWVSDRMKDDTDAVLAAVKQDGAALEHASARLQDDKDFVLAAVKQSDSYALNYASDRLKNDKEVVLAAVKNNALRSGWALKYASDRLENDKEVVLAAVKNYGTALQWASDRLKNDPDVVLAAVKNNEWALQYASARLQDDPDRLKKHPDVKLEDLYAPFGKWY